ncbi:MAG TPA: hypothetical protein VF677_11525, partial [Flavobacterium sp.]
MKKLFIIAILSCHFLNAQDVRNNPLSIIASPTDGNSHLSFGESLSTAGQASARLTFAGTGIQHSTLVWVPGTTLDNGKLNLSFGGSSDGRYNPTKVTFLSSG